MLEPGATSPRASALPAMKPSANRDTVGPSLAYSFPGTRSSTAPATRMGEWGKEWREELGGSGVSVNVPAFHQNGQY